MNGSHSLFAASSGHIQQARHHALALCVAALALALLGPLLPAARAADPPAAGQILALEECVTLAFSHNLGYLSDRQALEGSRASYEQAHAPFAIDASLILTAPSYVETQDTFEDAALVSRFQEENTTFRYETQLALSRRIDHVGRLSVRSTGFRHDFNSNRREDFLEYFGDVNVEYERQLLTTPGDEISLRQAELNLTISRSALGRKELLLEQHVTNTYFDLVRSIRQLEIQRQRLNQAEAALNLAEKKYDIGLIAEVEALRLQVEKLTAEAEFAQAETEIERRRDILRDVLGLAIDTPLEVDTGVQAERLVIDEERAVSTGLANRTDLRETELHERIGALELKRNKQQVGLNASLVAGVTLRGRGPEVGDVSDTFERSLVRARLNVGLPVVDSGWRRSRVRQGEVALEQRRLSRQMQRQAVVIDIRDAVRNVREKERQIDLRQASLEVSERQYEVEQARFELGIGDSQDLLDAQTTLTAMRTAALNAVIDYRLALQSLRVATMSELPELTPRSQNGG